MNRANPQLMQGYYVSLELNPAWADLLEKIDGWIQDIYTEIEIEDRKEIKLRLLDKTRQLRVFNDKIQAIVATNKTQRS